jgi:hypothetical protein
LYKHVVCDIRVNGVISAKFRDIRVNSVISAKFRDIRVNGVISQYISIYTIPTNIKTFEGILIEPLNDQRL